MSADPSSVESPLSVLRTMPSNMTSSLHRVTRITAVHGYDGGLWYTHVRKIHCRGRRLEWKWHLFMLCVTLSNRALDVEAIETCFWGKRRAPGPVYNESEEKSGLFLDFFIMPPSGGVRACVCMHLGARSGICVGCLDWVTVHLCKCVWVWECARGSWGSTSVKSSGWMGPCARVWMELRMRLILISWLLWLATSSTSKPPHHTHTHTHTCWHLTKEQEKRGERSGSWGGLGQSWQRKLRGERWNKTYEIEMLNVDGGVIHFISSLWSHQGSNDDGNTVCIMWDCVSELICIPLSSLWLSHTQNNWYTCILGTCLYGSWLTSYMCLCFHIFSESTCWIDSFYMFPVVKNNCQGCCVYTENISHSPPQLDITLP